jgi:tRNA pseudouridine synthase 10
VGGDIEAVLAPLLAGDAYNFLAAGREDMDVRMLGGGRTFVLEVDNARVAPADVAPAHLAPLEAVIAAAGRVAVRALSVLSPAQRDMMRTGEAEKRKEYRAVVWVSRPLTQQTIAHLERLTDVVLEQRTPVRVLHRRAPLMRQKMVHTLRVTPLPGAPCFYLLDCTCSAGTYVKEFVHGDWGRTRPSLVDLVMAAGREAGADGHAAADEGTHHVHAPTPLRADCVQLDVRRVDMDWL